MRTFFHFKVVALVLFAAALGTGTGFQFVSAEETLNEEPEFYRYTHEDGTVVFTDDSEKIPDKYRKTAQQVDLPPLVTIPTPKPLPTPKSPSRVSRVKIWYGNLSPLSKVAVAGILPVIVISLWTFYFLGGKTNNPSVKLILKITMGLVVAGSVYLLYFIFMKAYTEKLTRGLPIQIDTDASPTEMLAPIKQEEENRLKRIEEIADSP